MMRLISRHSDSRFLVLRTHQTQRSFALIAFAGLLLVACKPATTEPTNGRPTLTFVGRSDSGLLFDLEKSSGRSISFEGWQTNDSRGAPSAALSSLTCHSKQTSEATSEFSPLRDGLPAETLEISSRERMRLVFAVTGLDKIKGNRCHLMLRLK